MGDELGWLGRLFDGFVGRSELHHNGGNGRANRRVFGRQGQNSGDVFSIGMRVFPARLRPVVIHRTAVVLEIQEWTWSALEDPITIFVHAQVRVDQHSRFDPQVLGEPVQIPFPDDGARGPAAIAASQAVISFKRLRMSFVESGIQLLRWFFLPLFELRMDASLCQFGLAQGLLLCRGHRGSWNAGFCIKAVSVSVCMKAMRSAFMDGLNVNPPVVYFMKGSMVLDPTPPEL